MCVSMRLHTAPTQPAEHISLLGGRWHAVGHGPAHCAEGLRGACAAHAGTPPAMSAVCALNVQQIDSLVPGYSCPRADAIRNAYQSVPAWNDHLQQNADLKARLDAVFGTAGHGDWASWCASPLADERRAC